MKRSARFIVSLMVMITAGIWADPVSLSPKVVGVDGVFTTEIAQGRTVWVAANYLYFDVPSLAWFTVGVPVYVRIEYLDSGTGRLSTQYDSDYGEDTSDKYYSSEAHTRSSRINTGVFVYSFQMFENPRFANRQNGGTDFRIRLSDNGGVPFKVAGVSISSTPFGDEQFERAISKPWLSPNTGPVRDLVDNQTLVGKVMTGYQGWFRTPGDIEDAGWNHWGRSSSVDPSPSEITVDMWPYLNDYRADQIYPAGQMVLQSGRPAYLFSSADLETVQRHFRWMRKYNIDGAYLQRFVAKGRGGYYGRPEFVLDNVRKAAASEGRIWALEYDVSGLDGNETTREDIPFQLEVITNDWNYLVNECHILDDPRYAHEDGKPVLFIWGFGTGNNVSTAAEADPVISWFASQDLYLIGGVSRGKINDSAWQPVLRKYDQLLEWMERDLYTLKTRKLQLEGFGMKILPHAWPGFSWHNLKMTVFPTSYTARSGGSFYWTRIYNAIDCGADQIFLGMFDEYDEGTAIMPMNSDHPDIFVSATNSWGHYLDNEGLDPFWYLRLSGAAHELLNGQRTKTSTLPSESALHPVSCAGEDITSLLGPTNVMDRLTHPQGGDGDTTGAFIGDKECRMNTDPLFDLYFYFNIDDTLCYANTNGQNLSVEIEYYANADGATFRLQYDSLGSAYSNHPALVTASTAVPVGWKTVRWTVEDGYFGNRQNGGSDFRISLAPGKTSYIRRVSLFFAEEPPGTGSDDTALVELSGSGLEWSALFDATGWRLKKSTSLMNPSWQDVAGPFVFTNRTVRYDNALTNSTGFYRLERPARK